MAKNKLTLVFVLALTTSIFSSEDPSNKWTLNPEIRYLISKEQLELDCAYQLKDLPLKFDNTARLELAKVMPALSPFISRSNNTFSTRLHQELFNFASTRARVFTEFLFSEYYATKVIGGQIAIKKVNLEADVPKKILMHESISRLLYHETEELEIKDGVLEPLYDQKKFSTSLSDKLLLVEAALKTEKVRYTGKSRYVCPSGHAFHAMCIKKSVDQNPSCPTCRVAVTKKTLLFDPRYKIGEDCAICTEAIVPKVLTYSSSGCGGGSAGPADEPLPKLGKRARDQIVSSESRTAIRK